jgi:hypothetical protein
MPRRIQLSRKRGWKKPAGAVVCSRPGRWGNPFELADALAELRASGEAFEDIERSARLSLIARFEAALDAGGLRFNVVEVRSELAGKDLCCWCRLCSEHKEGKAWQVECAECAPCHVDVLLKKASRLSS